MIVERNSTYKPLKGILVLEIYRPMKVGDVFRRQVSLYACSHEI